MLVTSIFSFSHIVFLPFPKRISVFESHLFYHLQVFSIRTSLEVFVRLRVNPLPDDKILDWSKFKQIVDDILKCILNEKKSAILGRKYCEKRSNSSYLYILLKTGCIMGSPMESGWAGRHRPVLCLEHISKTILALVMKFGGWIDLIVGVQ